MLAVGASCSVVVTFSGAATAGGRSGSRTSTAPATPSGGARRGRRARIERARRHRRLRRLRRRFAARRLRHRRDVVDTLVHAAQQRRAEPPRWCSDAGLLGGGFAFAGRQLSGRGTARAATRWRRGSCQVTVTFTPPGPGSFAGTLGVAYDDGTGTTAPRRAPSPARRRPGAAEGPRLVRGTTTAAATSTTSARRRPGRPHLHDHQRRRAARDADGGRRRPRQRVRLEGRQLPRDRRHLPGARWRPAPHCTVVVRFTPSGSGPAPASSLIFLLRRREHPVREAGAVRDRHGQGAAADHRLERPPAPNGPGQSAPYDYGTAGQAHATHVHGHQLGRRRPPP